MKVYHVLWNSHQTVFHEYSKRKISQCILASISDSCVNSKGRCSVRSLLFMQKKKNFVIEVLFSLFRTIIRWRIQNLVQWSITPSQGKIGKISKVINYFVQQMYTQRKDSCFQNLMVYEFFQAWTNSHKFQRWHESAQTESSRWRSACSRSAINRRHFLL